MINLEYLIDLLNTIKQKHNNNIEKIEKNMLKLKKLNSLYKRQNKQINSYFRKINVNCNNYINIITNIDKTHELKKIKLLDKLHKLYNNNKLYTMFINLITSKINDLNIIQLHKNIINLNSDTEHDEIIENVYKLNQII